MRVLLISVRQGAQGGREQLSGILFRALQEVPGSEVRLFALSPPGDPKGRLQQLAGRIDGITADSEREILAAAAEFVPDCIVLDGSNLGRLARLFVKHKLSAPVFTFFHNVEAKFFLESLRSSPSIKAVGVAAANALAEYWATRYSKRRIMLNDRDSKMLGKLYGRGGTDLLPMALVDRYDPTAASLPPPHSTAYALFVGGSFFGNVEGIKWYAREVAPFAPMETIVLGRGMSIYRHILEERAGIKVIGEVDDLGPWYAHARIVVAPILSGSGMKTKTAEALMHGRPIAATREALIGYEDVMGPDAILCETPEHFLEALHAADGRDSGFLPALRSHYEQKYSLDAMIGRLTGILISQT